MQLGSLVMADLDHIKAVNDRNGHAAGGDAFRAAIASADAALYEAKARGRNRSILATARDA